MGKISKILIYNINLKQAIIMLKIIDWMQIKKSYAKNVYKYKKTANN